jgi:hypothetical protein
MTARGRRPPWTLHSLLAVAAILAAGAWRIANPPAPPVVAPAPPPPARVCVTHQGFCPVEVVRAGDPCACPDTLRGSVPGRVELAPDAADEPDLRGWPDRETEDPLERLGPLLGP